MCFERTIKAALCLFLLTGATALLAQPRLPDLTVVSTRVRAGRVTAVIANRGAVAPAVRATTTLFIHRDGQPTRSVDAVTPALLPGTTTEVAFDAVVPAGASFQVMVDSGRRVDESNETNNRTLNETMGGGGTPRPRGVSIDRDLGRQVRGVRLAPLPDREPRPVAVTRFPSGNIVPFVENELLLTTKNVAEAQALAARHGGKIVRQVDRPAATGRGSTFVIRVNTASAPPNAITAREGGFAFSSEGARNLLAIAAHERRKGTRATVNVVIPNDGFFEKTTVEGGGNDGLSLDYMQTGGTYDVDVAGAWKALFQAGKTSSKPILIGIVDSGFNIGRSDFLERDLDVAIGVNVGQPGQIGCGPGNPCPWHGQNVAEAAAGVADDGNGSTGPGAPVSRIVAIDRGGSFDSTLWAIFRAHDEGARIINMSFGGKVDRDESFWEGAWLDWLEEFESDTVWLNNSAGRLLFASAGNNGENIDATNDDGEAFWQYPCENQGVRCVGGWFDDASSKSAGKIPAPGSNFSTGGGEVVDIWGPWTAMVGDDFSNPGSQVVQPLSGTSMATPVVSGVAALIWAANPTLNNSQVWALMDKHAIQGGPRVRRVHAFRAVREALMSTGVNTAPAAIITSPANGASLSQASPTTLSVTGYDVEDESCCSAAWTINGQPAGTGKVLKHDFGKATLGAKTIAVTLTDSGGKTATASVAATLQNKAPTVTITVAPSGSVTQGVAVDLRAEVMDDTSLIALPDPTACPNLKWTSSLDVGVLATGCQPFIAFASPGSRTVTATYVDKFGSKGFDTTTVTVVAPAPKTLVGSIVFPKDQFAFNSGEPIVPKEQALQVNGTLTKTWTLTSKSLNKAKPIVLANVDGAQGFTLADVFPELAFSKNTEHYTLGLTLTTSSGQSATASVDIVQLAFIH